MAKINHIRFTKEECRDILVALAKELKCSPWDLSIMDWREAGLYDSAFTHFCKRWNEMKEQTLIGISKPIKTKYSSLTPILESIAKKAAKR